MTPTTSFDWADLAFGSKKPLRELNATFIMAPRQLSEARFKQLVKQYLPLGHIVLGISKEPFVQGLEDQAQFQMLDASSVQRTIDTVQASSSPYKIFILHYSQRETKYLLEKIPFRHVVLVNGSWKHAFHHSEVFYTLIRQKIPYEHVTPFTDENEAREMAIQTEAIITASIPHVSARSKHTESAMLRMANQIARCSFDHTFQTGATLGRPTNNATYSLLTRAFNRVVPYQTYALHHGSIREQHFSPAHDLNYYDTVHAEVELLIAAQKQRIDLRGTTVFINLLPCPTCARILSETDIDTFVYQIDHSDGYALSFLQAAGKTVRRAVVT